MDCGMRHIVAALTFGAMPRFLLGPRWLLWHAALVVVLAAFTLLGLWQLHRFEHHPRSRADLPVSAIDGVLRPGEPLADDDVARRVSAIGTYDDARTRLVPGRKVEGRVGFLVVTPLRTAAGVLPVVRGWVATRSSAATTAPPGQLTLTGRLQGSETSDASTVDPLAQLPADEVPYVATFSLLETWPYSPRSVYDGYVLATREVPAGATTPVRVEAHSPPGGVGRWRNLAYALNWWLFGVAALFFWGSVVRRAAMEQRTGRLPVR
jgi:cytochrome oxidase assembly protein ShyY1